MSSKNRKQQSRQQPARQSVPVAGTRAQPASSGKPASAVPGGGWLNARSVIGAAVVVLLGVVVYATVIRHPPQEASQASASAPAPANPAATPPAPVAAPAAANPAPAPVPAAALPPPKPTGPAIQFASKVYDMGKVVGDALVNCVFTFTNVGVAPLEIESVNPSCGCFKLGDFTKRAEPGQSGTINVRYDSRLYIGNFGKHIQVVCNDPAQRNISLEVKGVVWRAIEITPANAALNLCAEVPTNVAIVRLISHEEAPLILSDLKVENTTALVELQTNQPGKEYQLVVRSPVPTPSETQRGQITLKTSSTNQPVVSVGAYVNVLPILMAIPMQVRLPALPLETGFTNKFWVKNNGTNTLELSDPVINAEGVSVAIGPDPSSSVPMSVTLGFPAGFDVPAGKNLELRIKSQNPLFPLLTVPIAQTGRRPGTPPAPAAATPPGRAP